ncbi:MAG: DUF2249 domain-containing protein [Chitinophagaceae bacterium]
MIPNFINYIDQYHVIDLDVRPMLHKKQDPFKVIMDAIAPIHSYEVLKLITTFEPLPLIKVVTKKGFECHVERINEDLFYTYMNCSQKKENSSVSQSTQSWEKVFSQYQELFETIDVRELEMPLPMVTILEKIETLSPEKALLVYHKRIPVYLLPELEERGFSYSIKEIDNDNVHLLIYKP